MKIGSGLVVTFISLSLFAHGGKKHHEEIEETKNMESILEQINKDYSEQIEPIFKSKCLDCHGTGNKMPWYYPIPGAKQLIESDIQEAKEHMDMSKGFPFKGHGTPIEDLEELEEVIQEESMPPWQYKIMHWSSSLDDDEKKTIKNWITKSLTELKKGETK